MSELLPTLAHITALLDGGGQIMLGTVKPIESAAVAHDGRQTLVMLRRKPAESVAELLARLDAAVHTATTAGTRVDEINAHNPGNRRSLNLHTGRVKTVGK